MDEQFQRPAGEWSAADRTSGGPSAPPSTMDETSNRRSAPARRSSRGGDLVVHLMTSRAPAWAGAAGLRCSPIDASDVITIAAAEGPEVVVVDAAVLDAPDPAWVADVTGALGPVVAVADAPGDAAAARASGVRVVLPTSFLDAPAELARAMLLESVAPPAPAGAAADDVMRYVRDALHEFRTPLTVILEFAGLCLDGIGGDLSVKHREYLGHLEGAAGRLDEQLDDFRDTLLLRLGSHRAAPAGLPLRAAVEAAVADLESTVEVDDAVLALDHALGVDAERFALALARVLGAARKWSRGGGPVRVRLAPDAARPGACTVEVAYAGIAPSDDDVRTMRDGLVETEHGVDRSVARVFGLGVAMARAFLEAEGGAVRLAAAEGGGTYSITVPLADAPGVARAAA